jgi:hypothetical protein
MTLGPLGVLGGALGGGSADSPGSSPTPGRPTRPAAPLLPGPTQRVVGERVFDLDVRLPAAIAGIGYTVRTFVNGKRAQEQPLASGSVEFEVPDLKLRRGWNELAASIAGPTGEGPRSATIRVLVDEKPPLLEIDEPADLDTINAARATVRGRTQPGSTVEIRNTKTKKTVTGTATGGHFVISVGLGTRVNRLVITSVDPGGNRTVMPLRIRRGEGKLTASLSISAALVPVSTLPRMISLHVDVRDPDGEPIDGARVTFSLSPPGLPTSTYEAVTKRGVANWASVTIPRDGAVAGAGFATVLVVLRSGRTLRDIVHFRFS